MKRILLILLLLNCFSFAEDETIVINDEDKFFGTMLEKIGETKNKYNMHVEVLMTVNENGILSYKIIKESDIQKFNEEIIIFLEEKKKIKYPTFRNKKQSFKSNFYADSTREKIIYKNERKIED